MQALASEVAAVIDVCYEYEYESTGGSKGFFNCSIPKPDGLTYAQLRVLIDAEINKARESGELNTVHNPYAYCFRHCAVKYEYCLIRTTSAGEVSYSDFYFTNALWSLTRKDDVSALNTLFDKGFSLKDALVGELRSIFCDALRKDDPTMAELLLKKGVLKYIVPLRENSAPAHPLLLKYGTVPFSDEMLRGLFLLNANNAPPPSATKTERDWNLIARSTLEIISKDNKSFSPDVVECAQYIHMLAGGSEDYFRIDRPASERMAFYLLNDDKWNDEDVRASLLVDLSPYAVNTLLVLACIHNRAPLVKVLLEKNPSPAIVACAQWYVQKEGKRDIALLFNAYKASQAVLQAAKAVSQHGCMGLACKLAAVLFCLAAGAIAGAVIAASITAGAFTIPTVAAVLASKGLFAAALTGGVSSAATVGYCLFRGAEPESPALQM